MRACSGTWIAHGSGSADREVVDSHDRIAVPVERSVVPAAPRLADARRKSRATTTASPTKGCGRSATSRTCGRHSARSDWVQYERVNREVRRRGGARKRKSSDPIVLVQDYHFALVPRMVRERLPTATIITFWHIPWPNPEAFAICPWRRSCSTDCSAAASSASTPSSTATISSTRSTGSSRRAWTARPSASSYKGQHDGGQAVSDLGRVAARRGARGMPVDECRALIRERHGLPPRSRDRHRRGAPRLHEGDRGAVPTPWSGCWSCIPNGSASSPSSRSPRRRARRIEQYQNYEQRVRALAERINARFARRKIPPIILSGRASRAAGGLRVLPRRPMCASSAACTTE